MPQDYEVSRQVWDGKVPVEFVLESSELVIQMPKPYYTMLPRVSYFSLILDRVLKYFATVVDQTDVENVWLEYNGCALRWHYPIGVLFDLYKTDDILPWVIVVHFKDFPDDTILRLNSRDALESLFIQSIKEADQLKHKAEIINEMRPHEHKQLWNGFANNQFDQYWSINKKLMENNDKHSILHIPLRLYQYDKMYRQVLIKPENELTGERTTLADACRLFDATLDAESSAQLRIISHGIEIPTETPVIWLAENLCYPDNFVHVCLVTPNNN